MRDEVDDLVARACADAIIITGRATGKRTAIDLAPGAGANKQEYMVTRDGRFLINQPAEGANTTPITLILNWKPPKQ